MVGKTLDEIGKILASMVISAANQGRTVRSLMEDYQTVYGTPLNYRQFGFSSAEGLVSQFEGKLLRSESRRGQKMYFAILREDTAHMVQLTQGQRKNKISTFESKQVLRNLPRPRSATTVRPPRGSYVSRGRVPRGGSSRGPSRSSFRGSRRGNSLPPPRFVKLLSQGDHWSNFGEGGDYVGEISVPFETDTKTDSSTIHMVSSSPGLMNPSQAALNNRRYYQEERDSKSDGFVKDITYRPYSPFSGVTGRGRENDSPISSRYQPSVAEHSTTPPIKRVNERAPGLCEKTSTNQQRTRLFYPLQQTGSPLPPENELKPNTRTGTLSPGEDRPVPVEKMKSRPPPVAGLLEELKIMLFRRYPEFIPIIDLRKMYEEEYGFDLDPELYFRKTWVDLLTGLFSATFEVKGQGLKMRVQCKREVIRELENTPEPEKRLSKKKDQCLPAAGEAFVMEKEREESRKASERQPTAENAKSSLKVICKNILKNSQSRVEYNNFYSRVKRLTDSEKLLNVLHIWDMADLLATFSDIFGLDKQGGKVFIYDKTASTQVLFDPKKTAQCFDELVEELYQFALTQKDRRISRQQVQNHFQIRTTTEVHEKVNDILSKHLEKFSISYSDDGGFRLEAKLKMTDSLEKATEIDEFALQTFDPELAQDCHYFLVSLCHTKSASPSRFYVRLEEESGKLEELSMKMKDFYFGMDRLKETIYKIQQSEIKIGLPCAVVTKLGNSCVCNRAVVVERKKSTVVVFSVDCGQQEEVPLENLRRLPVDFVRCLPAQAISVSLAGVEPMGDCWDSKSTKELVRFFNGNAVLALAVKPDEKDESGIYHIDLFKTVGDEDKYFGDCLIEKDLAKQVETESSEELDESRIAVVPPYGLDETALAAESSCAQIQTSTRLSPYYFKRGEKVVWDLEDEIENELLSMNDDVDEEDATYEMENVISCGPPPGFEEFQSMPFIPATPLSPGIDSSSAAENMSPAMTKNVIKMLEIKKEQRQKELDSPEISLSQMFSCLQEIEKLNAEIKKHAALLPPSDPEIR